LESVEERSDDLAAPELRCPEFDEQGEQAADREHASDIERGSQHSMKLI
jgi:hypothetical protein